MWEQGKNFVEILSVQKWIFLERYFLFNSFSVGEKFLDHVIFYKHWEIKIRKRSRVWFPVTDRRIVLWPIEYPVRVLPTKKSEYLSLERNNSDCWPGNNWWPDQSSKQSGSITAGQYIKLNYRNSQKCSSPAGITEMRWYLWEVKQWCQEPSDIMRLRHRGNILMDSFLDNHYLELLRNCWSFTRNIIPHLKFWKGTRDVWHTSKTRSNISNHQKLLSNIKIITLYKINIKRKEQLQ